MASLQNTLIRNLIKSAKNLFTMFDRHLVLVFPKYWKQLKNQVFILKRKLLL